MGRERTTSRSSSSGRATSACRSPCARSRSGTTSSARGRRAIGSSASRAGESYVEDVSDERARGRARHRPLPADERPGDCAGFDVAVITVPTPLRDGAPDLSLHRGGRARRWRRYLRPGATVVLESTTYPGTTEELVGAASSRRARACVAGADFHLGYSPERIDPGNPTWTLREHARRSSPASTRRRWPRCRRFYDRIVERTVPVSAPKEAELTKLLENTFRHVNIALVNELAMFAGDLGIDVWEAIDAAVHQAVRLHALHARARASAGTASRSTRATSRGGCKQLARPAASASSSSPTTSTTTCPTTSCAGSWSALNTRRKAVNGSRILLLGLAYKRNTGDARESPGVARRPPARRDGRRRARRRPPRARATSTAARRAASTLTAEELAAADAVVLLTDHDAFDSRDGASSTRRSFSTPDAASPRRQVERL